jgi:hypothetical protein
MCVLSSQNRLRLSGSPGRITRHEDADTLAREGSIVHFSVPNQKFQYHYVLVDSVLDILITGLLHLVWDSVVERPSNKLSGDILAWAGNNVS